jgi:hypothetical protein
MIKKTEGLLAEKISIHSPAILFEVAESLREFIQKGLIKENGGTCSISEIIHGRPYPDDIINIEFETVPGKTKYLLSCETYHGFGGVFKKVPV